MKISIINRELIKEVYTMADAIQANKDALSIYSKGGANIPLRTNIDIPEQAGQSLYMPGYAADADALGVKIVSVYPNNIEKNIPSVPSTMVLIDPETGQVNALIDGTYLTQMRTGAVAGAGTNILARKDSKIFTIFGTGGQAEEQVAAVLDVREIEKVYVCDLNQERSLDFATRMAAKHNIEFVVAPSVEEAVSNADIITCVTTTTRPLFPADLVQPGTHINGIGSYTPQMQEIGADVLIKAGGVYCDTVDGVINEAGDLMIPLADKIVTEDIIKGELGQVINGDVIGRTSEEEITIFKSTGSAVLDVVNARRIYKKAIESEKVTSISI